MRKSVTQSSSQGDGRSPFFIFSIKTGAEAWTLAVSLVREMETRVSIILEKYIVSLQSND
jgi:hypothetical protein